MAQGVESKLDNLLANMDNLLTSFDSESVGNVAEVQVDKVTK